MPVVEVPLATVEDVQRLYETTIPAEAEDRVQGLLDAAVAKLVRLRPTLRADIDADRVDADLVRWALVSAVLRVLRNPAGYASETVGDLSYRLSTAAASGALGFSGEELAACTAPTRAAPAWIGSVRLAAPGYGVPGAGDAPWVDPWR